MTPSIINAEERLLIGMRIQTSLSMNNTKELWQSFRPKQNEIRDQLGNDLFSVQQYGEDMKANEITADTLFTRWAAVEVRSHQEIPVGMHPLTLQGGLYVVFTYKGTVPDFYKAATFIYNEWLPASDYELDHRDHFEILGEKYLGPMNPESEEDVFIPIKRTIVK